MITRTIARLDHMACPCKRTPSLVECKMSGAIMYRVEAVCCKIVTVPLRTELAAANEFQRVLAALAVDNEMDHSAVPQVTFQPQANSARH